MKRLFCILILLSCAAHAQTAALTAAPPPASPKYTVVNGQKFYLMQNARQFTGNGLSPSALNVLHHPRQPAVQKNNARPTPSYNGDYSEKEKKNDILSVFPEPAPAPSAR